MSDSDDTSQKPLSAFGALGLLVNNPLAANPDGLEQSETTLKESLPSTVEDGSKVTGGNDDEETSDFDDEVIQKKMSDLQNDFQSKSITPDDHNLLPRKSLTSGRLTDENENNSTPAINEPLASNTTEGPPRSMSASALVDHYENTEQTSTLPVLQDESSTDGDDFFAAPAIPTNSTAENNESSDQVRQDSISKDNNTNGTFDSDLFQSNTSTTDDTDRPLSANKQSGLDETARFAQLSPKPSTSRIQSASSKKLPSALAEETGTDADRNNQEVASIARRPSVTKSPVDRPRSPIPDDTPTNQLLTEPERPKSPFVGEQAQPSSRITSPQTTKDDTNILVVDQKEEPKQNSQLSTSRPSSTKKIDQPQTSRSSSAVEPKSNDDFFHESNGQSDGVSLMTNEQSSLIKQGESIQIPTNEIYNEGAGSPPPSPSSVKQTVLTNPILVASLPETNQNRSRPPSETHRKSPMPSTVSNEKIIDGDVISSKSRRSSNASQKPALLSNNFEQPVSSKRESVSNEPKATSRRNSSHQQEQKSLSSRRGSSTKGEEEVIPNNTNANSKDSRPSSTNVNARLQASAKQKNERISSSEQQQQSISDSNRPTVQPSITPTVKNSAKSRVSNEKRSSTADSTQEPPNVSKSSRTNSPSSRSALKSEENQRTHSSKQSPTSPPDLPSNEVTASRLQSPNVDLIAERNQTSATNRKQNSGKQKKKDQFRSTSVDSFNHIPLVDDKSLDSTSGNNTESEQQKQRRVKSKKKDVQTNTDAKNHGNDQQQQQQESTSQKPPKETKPMSDNLQSTRRDAPTKEPTQTPSDSNTQLVRRSFKKSKGSNADEDPVNVNVTVLVRNIPNEDNQQPFPKAKKQQPIKPSVDNDRHTLSDTEQIITEKQKKRRRPKRISRTTQTYERYFRQIEEEEHQELRPTNDFEKNIQTRRSKLRQRTRSPKKYYPMYLSTNAFKVEEILPKQFSQAHRTTTKTSVTAQSNSTQKGKLLILRPTLPFHHTDAVNVQRISLQYAIDLIPNENKGTDFVTNPRNQSTTPKQSEQTNSLPTIRSSSSTVHSPTFKFTPKDKSGSNIPEDRTSHRKNGGAF